MKNIIFFKKIKHNKKNRRKWKLIEMFKKILKSFGVILLFFIIIVDCMFFMELKKADGNPAKAVVGIFKNVANNVTNAEPIYILLLGQNKDLGQSLTDTIICLGYHPEKQEAFIISIPRDTFVGKNLSNAKPNDKINAIYSEKNPEKILSKVNELTGLEIQYYITIDNSALTKLVDIVGGVEFDVPIDMNYDDRSQNLHIHLKKGTQIINGEKAEQLLRFRHNNNGTSYPIEYGDNDFGRMKTGRNFIVALLNQTLKSKSIDEITEIIKLGFDSVKTNLSLSYILSYLVFATEFNTENLRLEQLPGKSIYTNGVWIFEPDLVQTNNLLEKVKF